MGQVAFQETFSTLHCASCGITYGVTEHFEQQRRQDRQTFYCPMGHSQWFPGETDAKRLKRLEKELKAERAAKRALRGQATKLRKRIANGVCPCCKRSFVELARHMKTKHPNYAKTEVGA